MASAFAQFAPQQSQVSPKITRDEALLNQFRSVSGHALESNPVDSITSALAGQDKPSQGLLDLADKAVNNQLPNMPTPNFIPPTFLDNVPMFDLATLSGMPPNAAMNLANQNVVQGMNGQNVSMEVAATKNFEQSIAADAAKNILADVDVAHAFDDSAMKEALKDSHGPGMGAKIGTAIKEVLSPGDSIEGSTYYTDPSAVTEVKVDPLKVDVADPLEGVVVTKEGDGEPNPFKGLADLGRTDAVSALMEYPEIRNWLNSSVSLVAAGKPYIIPENPDEWWDLLDDKLRLWLGEEITRLGSPDTATIKDDTGKYQPSAHKSYATAEYSGIDYVPGEYLGWEARDAGKQQIYQSLVLRGLPSSQAHMPHVMNAINARFPTVKGAYYLSDFHDDPVWDEAGLSFGASPFAQFVLKEDSPFKLGVTPEDTRMAFQDYVTASSLSREVMNTAIAGGWDMSPTLTSDQFAVIASLVNPASRGYDRSAERAILKAQAGWTGIGERGRLREMALDRLERFYETKQLTETDYDEGFIAFAASIKGSPWYKAVHGND